jgi:hypothetical protein
LHSFFDSDSYPDSYGYTHSNSHSYRNPYRNWDSYQLSNLQSDWNSQCDSFSFPYGNSHSDTNENAHSYWHFFSFRKWIGDSNFFSFGFSFCYFESVWQ